jgi:hypothetical protein
VELVLDVPVPADQAARVSGRAPRWRRPWSLLAEETAGMRDQGSFLSCRYRVGMLALTVIT